MPRKPRGRDRDEAPPRDPKRTPKAKQQTLDRKRARAAKRSHIR